MAHYTKKIITFFLVIAIIVPSVIVPFSNQVYAEDEPGSPDSVAAEGTANAQLNTSGEDGPGGGDYNSGSS